VSHYKDRVTDLLHEREKMEAKGFTGGLEGRGRGSKNVIDYQPNPSEKVLKGLKRKNQLRNSKSKSNKGKNRPPLGGDVKKGAAYEESRGFEGGLRGKEG